MGMWDKDREYGSRIDELYPVGSNGSSEPFILWAASIDDEPVETSQGEARRTRLQVAPTNAPTEKTEATTLASAIADKVERATADDFPVVACLRTVKSSFGGMALVIQLVRDYHPSKSTQAAANGVDEKRREGEPAAAGAAAGDDDIPF